MKVEPPAAGRIKCSGGSEVGVDGEDTAGGLSPPEKRRMQDRINKVLMEIETKKVAVKNIRLTLDKIDMTE